MAAIATRTSRNYLKRGDAISLAMVALHLGIVLAPLYLSVIFDSFPLTILAWLWCGIGLNGITNLMHEAAHGHVFKEKGMSDLFGRWVLGPLFFADFDGYRQRHWDHHRHIGEDDDPKYAYLTRINSWALGVLVLRCLFMVEAGVKFLHQLKAKPAGPQKPGSQTWILRLLAFHTVFGLSLVATAWWAHPHQPLWALSSAILHYGFVYLYGVMSLTVLFATLRAIAEHQLDGESTPHHGHAALRNFKCNALTRFAFGAYGFGEHYTHHEFASVPYYHLQEKTAELAEKDAGYAPIQGYVGKILELARGPGASAPLAGTPA
jgi:fatty acid desaturase